MQQNNYTCLKFVPFKNLIQWDLKRFFSQSIASKYPIEYLKSNINEENLKYQINDKNRDYGILGVNNQIGIFDAYIENGSKIKQKYKKMEVGWIAYNPYRVNVGSIGIKKDFHKYDYISPAYVVFSCREMLLPDYLFLLMKTSRFNQIIRGNTTGSVRQNLSYDILQDLQIPLPSLAEQESIVAAYNAKLAQAAELEAQAAKYEAAIEDYLLETLGASVTTQKFKKLMNFISFREISRWDAQFFSSRIKTNSKYNSVLIAECVSNFMTDDNKVSLRKETYKAPKQKFHYIGMENIEKETGTLLNFPEVDGEEIKSQTIHVPYNYFIYGKLRPYLNKYWKNTTDKQNIVCSSEFFVFNLVPSINQQYFKYVLASSIVQKQISDATSGARMPRINETTFKNIQIPLPPLSVQDEIAEHINAEKEQIKNCKSQAAQLRAQALADFEKEIFE